MSDPVQAARAAADELERLDAAMTAGPWVADCPRVNWRVRSGENYVMECGAQGVRQGEDAEAIAALRNRASSDAKLLRALADDVARLGRERDALRRELDRIRAMTGEVRHTRHEDCVGCGCMSLTAEEAVAEVMLRMERLEYERDRLRAACELTLRWLRGEVIERSVRDAIAEALAQPGDGAAGGGRG
jgi:hypothetical protein